MNNLKTILIVDDNEDNVDILCDILEDKYELFASLNGEDALEIVNEEKIDLILLDIMMPNIDGFEVCKRLKSNDKTKFIPVIFITAKTDEDSIEKAYEIGAVDYISKPFRIAEILSRVSTHLELSSQKENLEIRVKEAVKVVNNLNQVLENQKKDLILANEAKDMFLANMSHELKTPLNSINIISSVMKRNKENNLNEKQVRNLEIINFCGQSLLHLINDVLDISELEAGKIELVYRTFSLKNSMDKLYEMILPQAQENNIDLKYEIDKEIEFIFSDEQRINQIVKNLLSNSLKFAQNGNVFFRVEEDDEEIIISVKDDGIGIEEEKIEYIFDRFKQVDGSIRRKYGGNGLGLSICRELSKLLKGSLTVESEYKKGSIFTLKFPKNSNLINIKEYESLQIPNPQEKILLLSNNIVELMSFVVKLNKNFIVKQTFTPELFFEELDNNYKFIIIDNLVLDPKYLQNLDSEIIILCDDIEESKLIYGDTTKHIIQKPIDIDKFFIEHFHTSK